METIYDKINSNKYENNVPHPVKGAPPEERKRLFEARSKEDGRLRDLFYRDCCEHDGSNPDNPKTRKVFDRAWSEGHASGYYEVYNHFYDLAEFVEGLGVDLK